LDMREIMELTLRHLHPLDTTMLAGNVRSFFHPHFDIRAVTGKGFVVRELTSNPFCIDPSYFLSIRNANPADHLEALGFVPCTGMSLEPLMKQAGGYYRPYRLDGTRLSQLGAWWDDFGVPASLKESKVAYDFCLSNDMDWNDKRQVAVAGGQFRRAQLISARTIYRLFLELNRLGLCTSASVLATALYAAALRRRIALRRGAILLVPTDDAFKGINGHRVWELLAAGQEKELIDLIRDHILVTNEDLPHAVRTQRPYSHHPEKASDRAVARRLTLSGLDPDLFLKGICLVSGPFYFGDFTILAIDRIVWRQGTDHPNPTHIGPLTKAELHFRQELEPTLWQVRSSAKRIIGAILERTPGGSHLYRFYKQMHGLSGRAHRYRRQYGFRATWRRGREWIRWRSGRAAGSSSAQVPINPDLPESDLRSFHLVRFNRALSVIEETVSYYEKTVLAGLGKSEVLGYVRKLRKHWEFKDGEAESGLESTLRDLVVRHPTWAECWLELGFLMLDQKQEEEALRCFHRAASGRALIDIGGLCRSPRAQAYAECGRILVALSQEWRAAQAFAKSLTTDGNQKVLHIEYGQLLRRIGRAGEAASHFSQGMQYDQSYWCLPHVGRDAEHPAFLQETKETHMVTPRVSCKSQTGRGVLRSERPCPICSSKDQEVVYEHEFAPVYQLVHVGDSITDDLFSRLSVVVCRDCGHVFNRSYGAELSRRMYGSVALTNVPVHVSMVDSLRHIASWIGEELYAAKAVIEIGAGSGHLSRILAQRATSVLVFEPCTSLRPEMMPEPNITLINDYFHGVAGASKVHLVVCRQVIEHLEDPRDLMRKIRTVLADNGYAYLEVPSERYIAAHAALCDFHLAHVQYFSQQNFETLAGEVGLRAERTLSLKNGHDFGILFRAAAPVQPSHRPSSYADKSLASRVKERLAQGHTKLEKLEGPVAIYGATWHGQSFLTNFSATRIFDVALDDNESYAHCALYSRNQKVPIVMPSAAILAGMNAVIVGAYLHDLVIARKLRQIGYRGAVVSTRPEHVPENGEGLTGLFNEY